MASHESGPARPWLPIVLAGLGLAAAAVAWMIVQGLDRPPDPVPAAVTDPAPIPTAAEFVGSAACADCHAAEYERWRASQHAVAMQVADGSTVLGNFDGARFRNFGVTSEFFRRDGKFIVRTDGPDGKLADFEVRHTFGVYPLQQYLIELPGGHVQALSIAWDARPKDRGGQRWFHLYPNERIDHRDELHWTQRQQNWNFMCSDCHSTNVRKNYDPAERTFATTFSEISVGCEACHGPGSVHVGRARAAATSGQPMPNSGLTVNFDERRGVAWVIDPATGNAARSTPRTTEKELDVCAQCHARRGQFSNDYRAGEPLQDHYLPALLSEGLYHPDGQQRDEVFNWGSFVSSRMYAKGVTCGDCHEPHGGQLHAPGNGVCAQCHSAAKYDAASHHFHETGTPGAACAACHMKTETYMVVDPRHDHSFRIPRPDLSVSLGVPNACNQCHTDRNADWAAAEIRKRYAEPKPGFQGFAEAFAAADRRDADASIALTQVTANHDESAIARASAIERLTRRPGENTILAAEAGLKDTSPLVRRAAVSAFEILPPLQRRAVMPLLSDPVRTVRMQAARTLALLADDAEVADLERAALAHEDVERGEVAVQHLAAVQLAEHFEDAGDLPVVLQGIDVAHDRQFVDRPPGIEALGLHPGTADTVKDDIRQFCLQGADQQAGKKIPGGLSSHHGNPHHVAHQRIMPRFDEARKSTMRWTSGAVLAWSASCTLASSSSNPDL